MRFCPTGAFAAVLAALLSCSGAVSEAQVSPVNLDVLLPMTGPAALLGQEEQRSFAVAETFVNAGGGIQGRPVHFVVNDDQSNPQVALQLTNQLAARGVQVMLGSAFAASCRSVGPIVARGGPVDYCLAPIAHADAGSFQFVAGTSSYDQAAVTLRYVRGRGFHRVAFIGTTDATGADMDSAYTRALQSPENAALRVVGQEHYGPADISVAAQAARIKAAAPDVIIASAIGAPFGNFLHAVADSGLGSIPIVALNGNMLFSEMAQFGQILPQELDFPAYRPQVAGATGRGPVRDAQDRFATAFRRSGVRPDVAHVSSWDAIMLVVDALRALGPAATSAGVRAYIEGLHGWTGINGIYDFRDGSQRGIGQGVLIVARWDPKDRAFVRASKTGGSLH